MSKGKLLLKLKRTVRKAGHPSTIVHTLIMHGSISHKPFILFSEQHKYMDLVFSSILFNSTACFGCLFQPSAGTNTGSQKEYMGRSLSLRTVGIRIL